MSKKVAIVILISFIVISSLLTNLLKQTYNHKIIDNSSKITEPEIEDKEAPILELKDSRLILYQGDKLNYEALVLEAYDERDGDLLSKVKYTEIDTLNIGIKELEYSVKDNSGNETKKQIQVTILEKLPEYGE